MHAAQAFGLKKANKGARSMSRFFSERHSALEAYTPGEQPQDMKYIKLNTNESPFRIPDEVRIAAAAAAERANLYPDPECTVLKAKLAALCGVESDNIILTNGSDEVLNFIFMAYGDKNHPFLFPDITYGFYKVFAEVNNIPYTELPLGEDFTIDTDCYCKRNANIVIANPNAPTGMAVSNDKIREIAQSNPDNIITVDEAYVDFGGESAIGLTRELPNLIVTQTFSKSRSMAGARLGFAVAQRGLIADLNTIKYSTNPYNINSFTMNAAIAAVDNNDYFADNCKKIIKTRENVKQRLGKMGFFLTDSRANFLFARHGAISGADLYGELKKRGVLVRHFDSERIKEYNRITIGTQEQMDRFCEITEEILSERGILK